MGLKNDKDVYACLELQHFPVIWAADTEKCKNNLEKALADFTC